MIIEITCFCVSSILALILQNEELDDQISTSAKLIIFGTLLTEYPWMVLGIVVFLWGREISKPLLSAPKVPQIVLTPPKEGVITPRSTQDSQAIIEAVQILDYTTGESQYAFIQKADKSLLTQLGVTLKNTILLEKGRTQETSNATNSKLLSNIDHIRKSNNQNIQILYEDNSEYLQNQNKPQVSIPFRIGDFDQQMNEIGHAEILSGEYQNNSIVEKPLSYEAALVAILFGKYSVYLAAFVPQTVNQYFRIMNSLLFGFVLHTALKRQGCLTITHLSFTLLTLVFCCAAYALGCFYDSKQLLLGSLILGFQNSNINLQLLILPIPTILILITQYL